MPVCYMYAHNNMYAWLGELAGLLKLESHLPPTCFHLPPTCLPPASTCLTSASIASHLSPTCLHLSPTHFHLPPTCLPPASYLVFLPFLFLSPLPYIYNPAQSRPPQLPSASTMTTLWIFSRPFTAATSTMADAPSSSLCSSLCSAL